MQKAYQEKDPQGDQAAASVYSSRPRLYRYVCISQRSSSYRKASQAVNGHQRAVWTAKVHVWQQCSQRQRPHRQYFSAVYPTHRARQSKSSGRIRCKVGYEHWWKRIRTVREIILWRLQWSGCAHLGNREIPQANRTLSRKGAGRSDIPQSEQQSFLQEQGYPYIRSGFGASKKRTDAGGTQHCIQW